MGLLGSDRHRDGYSTGVSSPFKALLKALFPLQHALTHGMSIWLHCQHLGYQRFINCSFVSGTPTDTTLYIHMRKTVTLLYTWDWQLWHVHGFCLFHFKLGLNDFGKQSNYIKIYIIYILIIIKIIIVYFRTLNRANSRNTNNFCGIYLPSVFHSDNLFYFKSKHKYT